MFENKGVDTNNGLFASGRFIILLLNRQDQEMNSREDVASP